MNKLAIYVRKSTESEDRQVLSIESQVKELNDYAKKMNWHVVEIFSECKSAKAPGREIFNKLNKLIQNDKIDELLCWKLDRLARNPVDGGALIWAMEEKKLKYIHTPQRSFLNTGNDKFWLQLEFGMAKKYVDDLSDNVKRGLKMKVEKGWYPSKAPLGYLNDRENNTIKPDPERFKIVRALWDLMLTGGYTPPQVLKIATDKYGLRTKFYKSGGGNPVAYSYIYDMLKNPFYYGSFKYWRSDFTTRPKSYEFAYTGLIKCGACGASITAEHKTNHRYGCKYIYYHCTKRKRKCTQKYIQEPELTGQIVSFIDSLSIDKDVFEIALSVIDKQKDSIIDKNKAVIASLQNSISESERNLDELLTIKLRKLLSDDDFLSRKTKLEHAINKLNSQLAKIKRNPNYTSEKSVETFEVVSTIKTKFQNGSKRKRNSILKQIGSNLTLTDKKLLIQAKEPFNHFEKFQLALHAKNIRFEPQDFDLYNTQTVTVSDGLCAVRGLVDDVRTFFYKKHGYSQSYCSSASDNYISNEQKIPTK
jgi:DNA invertase Pin-like site-specific DNA recombinase